MIYKVTNKNKIGKTDQVIKTVQFIQTPIK